jgi:hypothetical protein
MFQLVKYKRWQIKSDSLILPFLQSHPPPESDLEKDSLISEAWEITYESFLQTPHAQEVIPSFENEIRQSLYDVRMRTDAEQSEYEHW